MLSIRREITPGESLRTVRACQKWVGISNSYCDSLAQSVTNSKHPHTCQRYKYIHTVRCARMVGASHEGGHHTLQPVDACELGINRNFRHCSKQSCPSRNHREARRPVACAGTAKALRLRLRRRKKKESAESRRDR